jgi:hypothetical protein
MATHHFRTSKCRLAPLLVCLLSQVGCLELNDEGDHLGAILNRAAVEMVVNHEQQRTLIYRPRRGAFQRYSVQIGKHYPCLIKPCDAPFGEYQGGVLVTVERGRSGTGFLSNYIGVRQPFTVDKRDADANVLLVNKGWYVEVRDMF